MSGAPVIALSRGGYLREGGGQVIGQNGSKFAGIYSGRLGADEMEAQQGIVWKIAAIEEVIRGATIGRSSFHMKLSNSCSFCFLVVDIGFHFIGLLFNLPRPGIITLHPLKHLNA